MVTPFADEIFDSKGHGRPILLLLFLIVVVVVTIIFINLISCFLLNEKNKCNQIIFIFFFWVKSINEIYFLCSFSQ